MAEDLSNNQTLLDKMSSEVTPATSPLLLFLTRNARMIVAVIAVCFVAAAGYGVYAWQAGKTVAEAQEKLARILIVRDDADRLAKLKSFVPTSPEAMRKGATLALAQAAMQAKDFPEALQAWEFIAKDPKDPLYAVATIGKAEALGAQEKYAEAIAALESMTLPADSEATNLVNSLIADFAEKTGDISKAVAACEKLVTGMAGRSPEEAEFWRQKAASLRAAKS
ncbi:conserved hypothetical protein [uncultured delta proteobacterium]|uniref:Ancillary SecYEG translocon subunit/Cell division coordinator CpoB TPR domain-containing protein n=1 Tax=uncultured delta proteobacterium TaxID=34034 RepID=A0A212ITI6_9DELT|nr:conserved hypothetical protein [uncultured delta proteobacterium]